MKIAAICGSQLPDSKTRAALRMALRGAIEYDLNTQIIELSNYDLVFFGQVEPKHYPVDVLRMREDLGAAQGLIFGTPDYYGGMTGALKNLLDLVGSDVLGDKIVGLASLSDGATTAATTLSSMRVICQNLNCRVLPQEVSVVNSLEAINAEGCITDPDVKERLLDLGRQVAKFAILQQRAKPDEFMQHWQSLS